MTPLEQLKVFFERWGDAGIGYTETDHTELCQLQDDILRVKSSLDDLAAELQQFRKELAA